MSMKRRDFVRVAGVGLAAGAAAGSRSAAATFSQTRRRVPPKNILMKVGTQHDSSEEVLPILAAFGVNHICSRLPSARFDENWSLEALSRLRERVEAAGIALDMVPLPMSSNPIARAENPAILLGKTPDRDR
jgi:mannonate dehydratase